MKEVHSGNFGLLIAYVVPGFVALWGVGSFSETVRSWFAADRTAAPTVGGFLFGTLAAIAAGLVVNAVRWHLVDSLHFATGVPAKNWDYSKLPQRVEPFRYLVSTQFRYYECYANLLVAIAFTFGVTVATSGIPGTPVLAGLCAVEFVLWSASRRTLLRYHQRIAAFLGECELRGTEPPDSANWIDPPAQQWYIRRMILPPRGILNPFTNRRRRAA